ncbi:MAG: hypothetical protein ABWK00_00595 [Desulfurococcaceae archaeon]
MSASDYLGRGSAWSRFLGFFKPKDPYARNIYDAIAMIDKMMGVLDGTRKELEITLEDYGKRAEMASRDGKKEFREIFDEEMNHISGLLRLLSKVYYELAKIKLRLKTITIIEEPMKLMPEIVNELHALRPEVERIAPELSSMLAEVERKVESIMVVSDLRSLAKVYSGESAPSQRPAGEAERAKWASDASPAPLPPLPPTISPSKSDVEKTGTQQRAMVVAAQAEAQPARSPAPPHVIDQWIYNEIMERGGVLDVEYVAQRYGLAKDEVLKSVARLEERGLVKVRRHAR